MMNNMAWDNRSQLEVLIKRAIDPYKAEPDYAAHLDVAKYIKEKKANTYVIQIEIHQRLI